MADYTPVYTGSYAQYPVYSQDTAFEGATKRFTTMPDPNDVYEYALMGLPKVFPLTNEMILPEFARPFLESAITEIEMSLECDLTPVTHWHAEDYVVDMFSSNYTGIKIHRWPATEIVQIQLKFPHTNTPNQYQTYTIPPSWIYLKKNKLNIVAGVGSAMIQSGDPVMAAAGGIFTYVNGFARGMYQPGSIEVIYKAGFDPDKLPTMVADLIKTWAAHRMIADLAPQLFPTGSVNVAIDGVSQSVSYVTPQMIRDRVENLEKKKQDLMRAFKKQFGRSLITSYWGT